MVAELRGDILIRPDMSLFDLLKLFFDTFDGRRRSGGSSAGGAGLLRRTDFLAFPWSTPFTGTRRGTR